MTLAWELFARVGDQFADGAVDEGLYLPREPGGRDIDGDFGVHVGSDVVNKVVQGGSQSMLGKRGRS